MSADNWSLCPNCIAKCIAAREKAWMDAEESYGKVSRAVYDAAVLSVEKMHPEPDRHTLREDYEIGISIDGVFEINYRCYCNVCEFAFKYRDAKDTK